MRRRTNFVGSDEANIVNVRSRILRERARGV